MVYSLNFHQTFAPEKEAIAQLVQLASRTNDFLSKEDISAMTAIPTGEKSGKVIPHIMYSEAMGLINVSKKESKYSLSLTLLGKVVVNEDPFLVEDLTHWLCHYNLASIGSPAVMWSYIFNTIIPNNGLEIAHQSLVSSLSRKFNLNKINLTPFRTCYTAEKSLGNLNILIIDEEKYIFRPHQINRTFRYLYGYLLLKKWEELLPNQSELAYNHLATEIGFGNPFLWDESTIMEILEMLQEDGIIIINRQLSPITIIRQASSETLLNKIYNFLI
jgi:hypothetical protein